MKHCKRLHAAVQQHNTLSMNACIDICLMAAVWMYIYANAHVVMSLFMDTSPQCILTLIRCIARMDEDDDPQEREYRRKHFLIPRPLNATMYVSMYADMCFVYLCSNVLFLV